MSFNEYKIEPPSENAEDLIQKLISLGQKIIAPGANFIDLLGQFVTPQLERARREWEFQVRCALIDLNKRQEGILQRLYSDAEFQSLLRQAFAISWKTHKVEKYLALKSGLMNSAVNRTISFDHKEMYFRLIDDLTNTHLVVLRFISEFRTEIKEVNSFDKFYSILSKGTISAGVSAIDRSIELSTFRSIMKDLETRGLILVSTELTEIDGVKRKQESWELESSEQADAKYPFIAMTKHGESFLTFLIEPN